MTAVRVAVGAVVLVLLVAVVRTTLLANDPALAGIMRDHPRRSPG